MKRIKILRILFDATLKRYELPYFRGAIAGKMRDHPLFHNHVDERLIYSYPLIQYKTQGEQAMIQCIEQGVDEIHALFAKQQWSEVNIHERLLDLSRSTLRIHEFNLQIWSNRFEYKIYNWLALSQKNFPAYFELTTDEERKRFLERILIANILSFAKGVDWHIESPVEVKIHEIVRHKQTQYKQTKLTTFDLAFASNVSLPDFIGLGKSVSVGYGLVRTHNIK